MDGQERPDRELPQIDEVLRRRGHSGGVEVPGSAGGPQDVTPSRSERASSPPAPPPAPSQSAQPPRSGAAQRPGRRWRAALVPVLVLAAGGLWVANGSYGQSGGTMTLSSTQVQVSVDGVADVRVRGGSGSGLQWRAESGVPASCRPTPHAAQPGAPMQIDITCSEPWLGDNDIEIEVPASTQLTLQGGEADVRVEGRFAAVSVTTDTGDVRLDDVTADIGVRSQRGDVRLDDVDGWVWVQADGGDVRGQVLASRSVTVRSGGDVRLEYDGEVPATTVDAAHDVRLELASGAARVSLDAGGELRSDVTDTPGAAQSVTIRGGGDVRVSD